MNISLQVARARLNNPRIDQRGGGREREKERNPTSVLVYLDTVNMAALSKRQGPVLAASQ